MNYRYIVFSLKFISSIFLGLLITAFVVQRDPWLKKTLGDYFKQTWEESLKCEVGCEVESINLLYPSIKFKKLTMKASDNSWSWDGSGLEGWCWWFDLIFFGYIEIFIDIGKISLNSSLKDNTISILSHIMDFLNGATWKIPTTLKSFYISQVDFNVQDEDANSKINLFFSFLSKNFYGIQKTKISFKDGSGTVFAKDLFSNVSGPLRFDVKNKSGNLHFYVESNLVFDFHSLQENRTCFAYGRWNYDQGLFYIKSQDRTFMIDPIKLYFLGETLFLDLNVNSEFKNIVGMFFDSFNLPVAGNCLLKLSSDFGPLGKGIRGSLLVSEPKINGVNLFSSGRFSFKRNKGVWDGLISLAKDSRMFIDGKFNFNERSNQVICDLKNESEICVPGSPYWKVMPKCCQLHLEYNNENKLSGNYELLSNNEKLESNINILGDVQIDKEKGTIHGKLGDKQYSADFSLSPKLRLKKLTYKDSSGKDLFAAETHKDDDDKIIGTFEFNFIKNIMRDLLGFDIEGEGRLKLYGMLEDEAFLGKLVFDKGSITIPGLYNLVNKIDLTFKAKPFEKSIEIKNSNIFLHKGDIGCKRAVINYDENYKPTYIFAPILFKDCFINIRNDLFSLVSGKFDLFKDRDADALLKGFILIERSQLKRNIFAGDENKELSKSSDSIFDTNKLNIACDISVKNKAPVRVNTPLLEASGNIDLSLKGNLFRPEVSGKIDFLSGSLDFPYKPLFLKKGTIYLLPQQPDDPIIELVAKNKINKYNISLYITGSMKKQNISFESAPILSEEQIVALLIAGSAQESLNVVMPALIMQRLTKVIFGQESGLGVGKYFDRLMRPFKNVHIVPSFADQTGRGGLRGSIEVDISERWKAFIQKNFSLTEDTRFEIEYLLADDVSVHGIRNENGDIGGEVEMKLKF